MLTVYHFEIQVFIN